MVPRIPATESLDGRPRRLFCSKAKLPRRSKKLGVLASARALLHPSFLATSFFFFFFFFFRYYHYDHREMTTKPFQQTALD